LDKARLGTVGGGQARRRAWIQNSSTNGAIEAYPEKIVEMGRIPGIRDLTCVNKGHVYQAKSGSNWLPGSGLQKVLPELGELRNRLHP
jgi:hypothetical protein